VTPVADHVNELQLVDATDLDLAALLADVLVFPDRGAGACEHCEAVIVDEIRYRLATRRG